MNFGQGAISFVSNVKPSVVPPQNVLGANNGVSLDLFKNVQLGLDGFGNGKFTSDRYLDGDLFSYSIRFIKVKNFYCNCQDFLVENYQDFSFRTLGLAGDMTGISFFTSFNTLRIQNNVAGVTVAESYFSVNGLDVGEGIRTGAPVGGVSLGAGRVRFGEIVNTPVALDPSNYLEVSVNGVLLKLALAVDAV